MGRYKSYTDIPQSKNLAKILPLDSADMCYIAHSELINIHEPFYKKKDKEDIPCWSLAALLNALPEIQGFKPIISLYYNYISYPHISDLYTNGDNLVDACYKMIIKLKERKGT